MSEKTNLTAAVIIPQNEVWRFIQPIRARYDRHFTRWMPHITMSYPFRPHEEFDGVAAQLTDALKSVKPFQLECVSFHYFEHPFERYTVWLNPEPREPLFEVQKILAQVVPDCNDVAEYQHGFTPHLSMGQARGEANVKKLQEELQYKWQPLPIQVNDIALVWREDHPDSVYRVGCTVPLGG